jgi:hypothetical protein
VLLNIYLSIFFTTFVFNICALVYSLERYEIRASMGEAGACWDNAVVEGFFWKCQASSLIKVRLNAMNSLWSQLKLPWKEVGAELQWSKYTMEDEGFCGVRNLR